MRLTAGMLRQIIKEEVTKVRRARLREMAGPMSLAVNAGGGSPPVSGMDLYEAIDDFVGQAEISPGQSHIDVAEGFLWMHSKPEIDKWCKENRLSKSSILSMVAERLSEIMPEE